MDKNTTRQSIYFLILARFILIIGCMIALMIQQGKLAHFSAFAQMHSGQLLIGALLLNCLYLVFAFSLRKFLNLLILVQVFLDLCIETALIYLTGGILSVFVSLYFGSILAAGLLVSPNSSLICASLATIGISSVALLYFLAAINHSSLPFVVDSSFYPFGENDFPFLKAYLFAQGMAFHLVAFFINRFSSFISRQRILHEEILENLTDGVVVIDKKQKIMFLNKQARILLEISMDDVFYGRDVYQIVDSHKHAEIHKALSLQKPLRRQTSIPVGPGILPIQLSIIPFSTTKKIQAYIMILRDISDQKRMEEAVKRANRLETISEMSATIAHEIRNPLASIRGAIQELQTGITPEDPHYILMDIGIRESDRINGIISDFLKFSSIRMPNLQKIPLNYHLQEFLFFLKKRPDMQTAKITLDVEDNLFLWADPEQMRQVFYNLAINALEASSGTLELTIRATKKHFHELSYSSYSPLEDTACVGVEISFVDRGKGIAEEHLGKLFTPFFTTKEHGTGMGLALVSKILDMHGSLYHVTSYVGKGTTFSIWIPWKIDF